MRGFVAERVLYVRFMSEGIAGAGERDRERMGVREEVGEARRPTRSRPIRQRTRRVGLVWLTTHSDASVTCASLPGRFWGAATEVGRSLKLSTACAGL